MFVFVKINDDWYQYLIGSIILSVTKYKGFYRYVTTDGVDTHEPALSRKPRIKILFR